MLRKTSDGWKIAVLVVHRRLIEPVINMKTAKAFGLTIPQSLLIRADEIIQ